MPSLADVDLQLLLCTDFSSPSATHCLFDVSILYRECDYGQAKYELTHSLRIHLAREDEAFNCMVGQFLGKIDNAILFIG